MTSHLANIDSIISNSNDTELQETLEEFCFNRNDTMMYKIVQELYLLCLLEKGRRTRVEEIYPVDFRTEIGTHDVEITLS